MKPSTILTILFLVGFGVFSIGVKNDLQAKKTETHLNVSLRQKAPDFTLVDSNGDTVSLSEVLKVKKLVMVNFWATWCEPCRLEMPQFKKMHQEYKDRGFEILAISCDHNTEDAFSYLEKKPVSFPVLLDPTGATAKTYGVNAFPTTILIDKNGMILQIQEGMERSIEYAVKRKLEEYEKND